MRRWRSGARSAAAAALAAALTAALTAVLATTASAAPPAVRIGFVVDGPSSYYQQLADVVRREILVLAEGELEVRFAAGDHLVGDWTQEQVSVATDLLLADPEVDLVIALGVLASHEFCCRSVLVKPVIAPLVIDPTLQNLPQEGGTSGVHNLSYLAVPSTLQGDLDDFRAIVPLRRVTTVINRWFLQAVPVLMETFRVLEVAGVEIDFVAAGTSVEETLAAVPADADGVYLAPLLHFDAEQRRRLYRGLTARGLPTFSMFGVDEVENGVLAGRRSPRLFDRLARRIALNVQRILLGEDPATLPVAFPARPQLTVNMATARALGLSPPWSVLREADLLFEEAHHERLLSIATVVDQAIDANLDLAAGRRAVAAGAQGVPRARGNLLPQLEATAGGVQIDDDRAAASLGSQAERTWSGGLTLTQVIVADGARAALEVERYRYDARQNQLETLRLDIARDAAVAYFSVLRARTLERIRKDNLRLTRSNLRLAEVRRDVGDASPGEVYRWQSQVATARRDLVGAQTARRQSEIALNRLLHRPLEEGFRIADVVLAEPTLITSRQRVYDYVDNPRRFQVFRDFVAGEGLRRSPELAQIDASIAAQRREALRLRRSFWLPQAFAQLSLDHIFARDGGGAGTGIPGLALPSADDTSWTVALLGSLALYQGGARRAETIAAEETLGQLELERAAAAERLEQGIRASLLATQAAYVAIDLSRQAADAAGRNLALVTDAYTRGVADILDLLDAQNAALAADLGAADALYAFFIELVTSERAANNLDFFLIPEEQEKWLDRLRAYFLRAGIDPERAL